MALVDLSLENDDARALTSDLLAPRPSAAESYYERIKVKLSLNGMQELRRRAIEHRQKDTR